jgi:hypothetical protein
MGCKAHEPTAVSCSRKHAACGPYSVSAASACALSADGEAVATTLVANGAGGHPEYRPAEGCAGASTAGEKTPSAAIGTKPT